VRRCWAASGCNASSSCRACRRRVCMEGHAAARFRAHPRAPIPFPHMPEGTVIEVRVTNLDGEPRVFRTPWLGNLD
jgi:hypothetical protein